MRREAASGERVSLLHVLDPLLLQCSSLVDSASSFFDECAQLFDTVECVDAHDYAGRVGV